MKINRIRKKILFLISGILFMLLISLIFNIPENVSEEKDSNLQTTKPEIGIFADIPAVYEFKSLPIVQEIKRLGSNILLAVYNRNDSDDDLNVDSSAANQSVAMIKTTLSIALDDEAGEKINKSYSNENLAAIASEVMAWIYPGNPACGAQGEYADGRIIGFLKPEYFTVGYNGEIRLITVFDGCNGYSVENIIDLQENSKYQFATVSSDSFNMKLLVNSADKRKKAVSMLIDFVLKNDFSGVEIDFEGFGVWDADDYGNYKEFMSELGSALHAQGKKLMIDGPPISNQTEQDYYLWRYEDFVNLPVDYIVVMAYDYMFDWGAGAPITPNEWLEDIVNWAKDKIGDTNKIVIGLPSYGYHGLTGRHQITIDTKEQTEQFPGFKTAQRNADSYEMVWENAGITYVYQDSVSLDKKKELVESMDIKYVSIFHLGGNDWFSK